MVENHYFCRELDSALALRQHILVRLDMCLNVPRLNTEDGEAPVDKFKRNARVKLLKPFVLISVLGKQADDLAFCFVGKRLQ